VSGESSAQAACTNTAADDDDDDEEDEEEDDEDAGTSAPSDGVAPARRHSAHVGGALEDAIADDEPKRAAPGDSRARGF
jgi:hypothetical protein